MIDNTRCTGASRYRTWVSAETSAHAAHAASGGPNDAACSAPVPDCATRHRASRRLGIIDAASLISARTGVIPRVPMMSALVMSAPSQCEKSMTSWPGDAREEVLVAAGEPDDLVREHRADHQRDIVVDDGAVEDHLDGLVESAVGQLGDPVGADSPEGGEGLRFPPFVVEHGHPGIGAVQAAVGVAEVPARCASLIAAWVPSAISTVT